jgi:hypothetical protein
VHGLTLLHQALVLPQEKQDAVIKLLGGVRAVRSDDRIGEGEELMAVWEGLGVGNTV